MTRTRALALGCALLALSSPANAFRTGADRSELSATPRVSWDGPIYYEVNDTSAHGIAASSLAETVERAAQTWQTPVCSIVRFEALPITHVAAAPDDGRNTIQWISSGWSGRGFGADSAGATDVLYEQNDAGEWRIREADVYLNAEGLEWSLGSTSETVRNPEIVLIHELGHALGLLHPCESGGADGAPDCASDPGFEYTTMYPFYRLSQTVLGDDDVEGVCFLYPVDDCEQSGCQTGHACTPQGCVAECGGALCARGEVCKDGACAPIGCGTACGCSADTDCPEPLSCIDRRCQPGRSGPGDLCAKNRECSSGVCDGDGFCATGCDSDSDCASGKCTRPSEGPAVCDPDGAGFGQECSSKNDCRSSLCIQVGSDPAVCTRECADRAGCPVSWSCATVDGERVCRPPLPWTVEDEGCAVRATARSGSEHRGLASLLALLAAVVAVRRRRQKQTSDVQLIRNPGSRL